MKGYVKKETVMSVINLLGPGSKGRFTQREKCSFKRLVKIFKSSDAVRLPNGVNARLFFDSYDESNSPELMISGGGVTPKSYSLIQSKALDIRKHIGYVVSIIAETRNGKVLESCFIEFASVNPQPSELRSITL